MEYARIKAVHIAIRKYNGDTEKAENSDPNTNQDQDEIVAEASNIPLAFHPVMTPEEKPFYSAEEYFGPHDLGAGSFTSFLQFNYTNNEKALYFTSEINVTQPDPGKIRPFQPENMIIVMDGVGCPQRQLLVNRVLTPA